MTQHPFNELIDTSMKNLRNLVDVNTIIGDPIHVGENITIIPVSKVTFGFASAGGDLPTQKQQGNFGGGSGSGVTIQPLGFLVVQDGNVQFLQISTSNNTADRVVNMVPGVMDKIMGFINKEQGTKAADKKQDSTTDTHPVVTEKEITKTTIVENPEA